MKIIKSISEFRAHFNVQTNIALVPTMGNLHAGHLQLINRAKQYSDIVVASVFVNPLQFLPHEDYNTYPRTLDSDCEKLAKLGCTAVFAPNANEMYKNIGEDFLQTKIVPPTQIADILEGEFRPGFFTGVATVVLKLFNIINPTYAVFGKKDFQQLMVIENMVASLNLPINIIREEIIREDDGLAMSSRNLYLSTSERKLSVELSQTLKLSAQKIGKLSFCEIENDAIKILNAKGWIVDYISIRRQNDLQTPLPNDKNLIILGAAKIGKTRLIDNLEID